MFAIQDLFWIAGAIREARTLDLMIKSHVLYQLSYNRILEQDNGFEPSLSAWKANVLTVEH